MSSLFARPSQGTIVAKAGILDGTPIGGGGGGSTTPGGSSGQFQYNDGAGGFAGAAELTRASGVIGLTGSTVLQFASDAAVNHGTLQAASLTDARTWTLPDKSGTVAMTSDITALAIGNAIGSGTATRVLFQGAGPVLADSANLTWDDSNSLLTISKSDNSPTVKIISTGGNTPTLVLQTASHAAMLRFWTNDGNMWNLMTDPDIAGANTIGLVSNVGHGLRITPSDGAAAFDGSVKIGTRTGTPAKYAMFAADGTLCEGAGV